MTLRAVVFDIGGVLEIAPPIGVTEKWEALLHLAAGELNQRLENVWRGGSVGHISEQEVHRRIGEIMAMEAAQVDAFMDDIWTEYLGTLNTQLTDYVRSLRPRYQTAILSNSFVGARRKEQERYQFEQLVDLLIYSHEEGIAKPTPRIFELTCERLGVQPAEMVFVDDVEVNIAAAQVLGIHAIRFRDTAQTIADLQACLQANGS